ncbi:MAG: DUF952 domain-containing protein [Hyphomicrobiales bacterium]
MPSANPPPPQHVFKIFRPEEWAAFEKEGRFEGSADDRRDGFIHLSTGEQLAESIRRHFADATEVVVASIEAAALGADLRWEPSRGGQLFPHHYGVLPRSAVTAVERRQTRGEG